MAPVLNGSLVQSAVTAFVHTFIRGISIEVLQDNDIWLMGTLSLNKCQNHLVLSYNETQRAIPLQELESVASPRNFKDGDTAVDERCCTLIIRGTEFITLRLDTKRHREYFAACLTFLSVRVDGVLSTP